MADNVSILNTLRENNPFESSASPLPYENNNPDLQQLNRETSEEIEQLLRHKRRQPNMPLAGLILGEPGSGKTHMLTRILRRLRKNALPAIFVTVKTFRDPESVTQHILSEIFISLKLIHSGGRSQFDMMMHEFMNTYTERRHNDGFTSIEKIDMRTYLSRDIPRMDRNFLKCLITYMAAPDEITKTDLLDWLCVGLDEDSSLRLGLPARDIYSMSDARRESEAEKILISLGLTLAYAKVPMIICFDQLDAIRNPELIQAWGDVISLLMNDLSGILPLCFMKAEVWNNVFRPVLDPSVLQRLEHHTMIMKECSIAQAHQLIRDRIACNFGEDAEYIYKWLVDRIGSKLTSSSSPRMVIEIANKVINDRTEAPVSTRQPAENLALSEIDKAVKDVYDEECRKIHAQPITWPPNTAHLSLALEVWLRSHEGFEISEGDKKCIKFFGTDGERKFAFIVTTSKSHFVVSAALTRGMAFIREYPDGKCFYISEDRTHKKTWKLANENLEKFCDMGGVEIILDDDMRAKWYGLTALINRIDNGDVNLYVPQKKIATRDDIKGFVKSLNLLDITFAPEHKQEAVEDVKLSDDMINKNLRSILNASPMRILTVEKAIELLARRNINITRNEILAFVNKYLSFRIFQSQSGNDTLISILDEK